MQIYSFLSFDGIFQPQKIQQLNRKADFSPLCGMGCSVLELPPPINLSISSTDSTETRILSHTDPTKSTELHWFIRDSYGWYSIEPLKLVWMILLHIILEDMSSQHLLQESPLNPINKYPCTFEYYLCKSVQSCVISGPLNFCFIYHLYTIRPSSTSPN